MPGWKQFFEREKDGGEGEWHILQTIRGLKKSDWAVVALVGILLLVIAIPVSKDHTASGTAQIGSGTDSVAGGSPSGQTVAENTVRQTQSQTTQEAYVSYLEDKMEQVLSQMEGVGSVKVMITVSDVGESVVEKDRKSTTTVTEENDSAGGSRTVSEADTEEQTIYVETGDETYPYIQKEKLPTVEGVVVVAEGGGSPVVVSNISESVKALLSVEAHRIKVVKMCSKEE